MRAVDAGALCAAEHGAARRLGEGEGACRGEAAVGGRPRGTAPRSAFDPVALAAERAATGTAQRSLRVAAPPPPPSRPLGTLVAPPSGLCCDSDTAQSVGAGDAASGAACSVARATEAQGTAGAVDTPVGSPAGTSAALPSLCAAASWATSSAAEGTGGPWAGGWAPETADVGDAGAHDGALAGLSPNCDARFAAPSSTDFGLSRWPETLPPTPAPIFGEETALLPAHEPCGDGSGLPLAAYVKHAGTSTCSGGRVCSVAEPAREQALPWRVVGPGTADSLRLPSRRSCRASSESAPLSWHKGAQDGDRADGAGGGGGS